jgi:hypothetical protein
MTGFARRRQNDLREDMPGPPEHFRGGPVRRTFCPLGGYPFGHLRFNYRPDHSPCPFDEGEFVGQAAFQQHANGIMTRQIGGCDPWDFWLA